MKKLPIGIQTFSDMILEDYLYVDKTEYIYHLLADSGKYYFISRPRRFGKSLLVSTLKEIFSGKQDLFKDLWIYDKIEWQPYPVIHIDFLGLNFRTPERLEETLARLLDDIGAAHGLTLDPHRYVNEKFKELIIKLAQQAKVVILIDEYDKPIIDNIDQPDIAAANRDILREFYDTIKGVDAHIKFTFITGVSKFSRVSVFSGLNNLRDITISESFSTMMGYTGTEFSRYFGFRISALAEEWGVEEGRLREKIGEWYNGYSWDGRNFVFNPHSILNFFQEKRFDNYWFTSGTPAFLIKLIKKYRTPVDSLDDYETDQSVLDAYDVDRMNVVSLLFQTGYLTIRKIKTISLTSRMYHLSFPNAEVKESFLKHILAEFSEKFSGEIGKIIYQLAEKIRADDLEGFFGLIKSIYASIPYNIFIQDRERYYHTIIYLILTLLDVNIQSEVQTNQGRIDAVIETEHYIYIMEFKLGTAAEALEQIKQKKYHEKYLPTTKHIKLVGVGFDLTHRNINTYQLEDLKTP